MFQVANQLQIEEGEHRGVSKSMGRQRALARCLPTLIALAAAVSSAGAHAADWFVRPNGGRRRKDYRMPRRNSDGVPSTTEREGFPWSTRRR